MKKPMILIASALLLAVPSACGGDDNGNTTNATTSTTEKPATPSGAVAKTINVSLIDFAIDPKNPRAAKPGTVEIRATNDGQTEHSLEVEGPEGERELDPALGPGESGTLKVALDKPGKYEWYCPIGNHRDLGMEGEITVGSGGSNTTGANTTGENTRGGNTTGESTTEESGGSGGSGSGGSGSGGSGSGSGGY